MAKSYLVLEDGSVFEGEAFGYEGPAAGEVVFSTGMSGYQESLTDPSFRGQILVMTYPLIGNYGITDTFCQSEQVHTRGLVVREYCREPSPMYGGCSIDDFLKANRVPGISGIDTRDLAIKIRTGGTLKGAVTQDKDGIEKLIKDLKRIPAPSESNLVEEVSVKRTEEHNFGNGLSVGILDLGGMSGILKDLSSRFNVTVFPYDTPADVITESGVKGIIISNGPGDPSHPALLKTAVRTVSDVSARMPVYGMRLGDLITGIAMGGKTYKMKFGHRGSNQPVKYEGRVFITSQNHGYAVDESSLNGKEMVIDQINVNDGTAEGMRHNKLPVFTSQYCPDQSSGLWDTAFLLDNFEKAVKGGQK